MKCCKRILTSVLCLIMLLSFFPVTSFAVDPKEEHNVDEATWEEYWEQYWDNNPAEWQKLESSPAESRSDQKGTATTLSAMRERAEALVNYTWTPTSNINTWNGNTYNGKTYFPSGSTVKGIPYTLFTTEVVSWSLCSLTQYQAVAFQNYSATAYCASVGATRTGPVYGSCCADLVSEVFGGNFMNGSSPRYHSVGAIWNTSYGTTIHSQKMSDIRAGDALSDYPNHYHIVWVGEVTDSTITIYEQTPPVARKLTLNKAAYTNSSGYFVYGGKTYSTITRSKEFENPNLPHTHDRGEYVYYEAVHPHYSCYRCSICGIIWRDETEKNYIESCAECVNQLYATIANEYMPRRILQGSTPSITGIVTAGMPMSWAWLGVLDKATGNTVLDSGAIRPNSDTWDISSSIDNLDFTNLPAGEYRFRVDCMAGGQYFVPWQYDFSVVPEEAVTATIDGASFPSNMLIGTTPTVTGIVYTTLPMSWAWLGVLDKATGNTVLDSGAIRPNSDIWDISNSIENLDFTTLPKGEYTFRVDCVQGGRYFVPYLCDFSVITSDSITATIENAYFPSGILVGTTPTVTGVVYTTLPMSWAWLGVLDKATGNTVLDSGAIRPNANSWDISNSINNLDFTGLPVGEYIFRADCMAGGEYFVPYSFDFFVISSDLLMATIDGASFPDNLLVGTTPSAAGIVHTTLPMSWAWLGVLDKATGDTILDSGSIRPNSDTWDISNSIDIIDFTSLPAGEYTFRVDCMAGKYFVPWAFDFSVVYCIHNYLTVVTAPTCTEQGYTTYMCSNCGDSYKDSYVDALGHSFGLWTQSKAPTCTEKGEEKRVCSRCGYTEIREIVALGHDWNAPVYAWADDNSNVTASRTCRNDQSHTEVETVNTTWEVTKEATYDEEGEITYTAIFQNAAFATQIKVVKTPNLENPDDPEPNPFDDVTEGKYYYAPVLWAYYHDQQITSGTSETTFSPNAICTRAQIMTFLWRLAGSPEPQAEDCPFTDVSPYAYFYEPVLWAFENNITTGTGKSSFSPYAPCSRAQAVTFLWRFTGSPEPEATNTVFTDVDSEAYYYKAVLWAAENIITVGTSNNTFSPGLTCNRAQIVTFLYRFSEE